MSDFVSRIPFPEGPMDPGGLSPLAAYGTAAGILEHVPVPCLAEFARTIAAVPLEQPLALLFSLVCTPPSFPLFCQWPCWLQEKNILPRSYWLHE